MKRFLTVFAIVLAILLSLFLYQIYKPENSLTTGLASSSQEKRDAAAKILRATAKPPSEIKWLIFKTRLKFCKNETDVLKLLKTYNVKPEPGILWGSLAEYAEYQLDDYWILKCAYDSDTKALGRWKVVPGWRGYDVQWPTNLTGAWITYFANGQKFIEGNFSNGRRSGEFVEFNSAGSTNFVCHFDNDKQNGLWTQFFPSGQIQTQCLYSNNSRIGEYMGFYENGSKRFVNHYSSGELNGQSTVYFQSGKIESQCLYSNFQRIGLEIKYNEDGTTNSVINHSQQ